MLFKKMKTLFLRQGRRDGARDRCRDPPASARNEEPPRRPTSHPAPGSTRPAPASRPIGRTTVPRRHLADSPDARGRLSDVSRCVPGCEEHLAAVSNPSALSQSWDPATGQLERQPRLVRRGPWKRPPRGGVLPGTPHWVPSPHGATVLEPQSRVRRRRLVSSSFPRLALLVVYRAFQPQLWHSAWYSAGTSWGAPAPLGYSAGTSWGWHLLGGAAPLGGTSWAAPLGCW